MENNDNDKIYQNLITILKLFQSRPYHLSKYLMESNAFNEDFLQKIKNSDKLNSLNNEDESNLKEIYFLDVSHMKDFFNSLTDGVYEEKLKNKRDISVELSAKLNKCLRDERYEDAIRIRDYMQKNGIEIKKD